ncbi:MAG: glycosyltransferase family 2 protein [Butyrivibrio sp.]|nr:glycosyltransferase family 2 protein [Butyrivibrio sp.]
MYRGKKIGIVILNYNDSETAEALCKSIHSYKTIDKIVVVDNNSSDNSYEKLLQLQTLGIDIIKCDRNGGYSYGNNYGAKYLVRQYQVDIIFISNPDVEFTERFVERISSVLVSGDVKAASGIMMNNNGQIDVHSLKANSYLHDLLSATLIMKKLCPVSKDIINNGECIDTEILPGSLFAIAADAWIEIGGFDEGVFLYYEEAILGKRLKEKGYTLKLVTSEQFTHHHSVSINKSVNRLNRVKQIYKSALYYWRTYGNVGKFKIILMKVVFAYGILMRKIVFKVWKMG